LQPILFPISGQCLGLTRDDGEAPKVSDSKRKIPLSKFDKIWNCRHWSSYFLASHRGVRIQPHASPRGICGGQTSTGADL